MTFLKLLGLFGFAGPRIVLFSNKESVQGTLADKLPGGVEELIR